VNKCASGGVAEVRIIQLNYHFPTISPSKFGVRIVQVCVLYIRIFTVIELFLSLVLEVLQGKKCQNSLPSGGGRSLGDKISGGSGRYPANILISLERQLIALKLFSRLFVLYCRNCPKDDKFL